MFLKNLMEIKFYCMISDMEYSACNVQSLFMRLLWCLFAILGVYQVITRIYYNETRSTLCKITPFMFRDGKKVMHVFWIMHVMLSYIHTVLRP